MKVAVFGATGMLGHSMNDVLRLAGLEVVSVGRTGCDIDFSVGKTRLSDLDLSGVSYIVNCIGVITHLIDENDESDDEHPNRSHTPRKTATPTRRTVTPLGRKTPGAAC